jgi:phospholipid/cholesterol/gamma-HCH transport system permease protein
MSAGLAPVAFVGRWARRWARGTGAASLDLGRTLRALPRLSRRELLRGLWAYGWGSLPLTLGLSVLAGAIVIAQTAVFVEHFGARAQLGWAAGYAAIWEFAPLLLAVMMGARVGARNAAELAALSLGGQIEGLEGLALDPFALLIAPRILAITLSTGLLFLVTASLCVVCEALSAYAALGLPVRVFFETFAAAISWREVLGGLIKALAFGLSLAVVSSAFGLRARGGARAVGNAAAAAVVWSAASTFSLDFFLTSVLARVLHR